MIPQISDARAVSLAEALQRNSTVRELKLSNNSITDAGAVALAQALHHNSTLSWLYLCITDTGAVALAQALHHNFTLRKLSLFKNNISDAGVIAQLRHSITALPLEMLHLNGNDGIGEEGTRQLVQALIVNRSIIARCSLVLPKKCEEYATQCELYYMVSRSILSHYATSVY